MAELFCNGGAMRGGNLHQNVSQHRFLGAVTTAPKYRFFSVRDEFPALLLSETGGAAIEGELYERAHRQHSHRFPALGASGAGAHRGSSPATHPGDRTQNGQT